MSRPNHLTLEQKHAFVELAAAADTAFAGTCRAFRISRQTGYKWLGCIARPMRPGCWRDPAGCGDPSNDGRGSLRK
jgi:hypothetical protein